MSMNSQRAAAASFDLGGRKKEIVEWIHLLQRVAK